MKLTLLQTPGRVKIDDFDTSLQAAVSALGGELAAKAKLSGFSKRGWAQVDVSGEDHEILGELITRELGRATTNLSNVELFGNYSAIIRNVQRNHLEVDIGIEVPRPLSVKIDVSTLRAQLCDGKPLAMEEITESYCLQPESKIAIRITHLESESGVIEGWLADSQLDSFSDIISFNLERVQVYHCTRSQIDSAVRRNNIERDIISVENMSLTTHSVICKLGTDAIGLIPKLGSALRMSGLRPFIPSRITSRCRKW